tara:strand:- start:17 stop:883 length:867 start_codon:yes stop_codon:yes gene_type:complete
MVRKMKCDECGCREFELNERLGERECSDCGLIQVYEAFEESVSLIKDGKLIRNPDNNTLGSIITGKGSYKYTKGGLNNTRDSNIQKAVVMGNMLLAKLGFSSLKREFEAMYISLYRKHIFKSSQLEIRVSGIAYILLEENATPVKVKEICQEYDCSVKLVNRMIRSIRKVRKPVMQDNSLFKFKRELSKVTDDLAFHAKAVEVYEYFETIISQTTFNKGKTYNASICWITVNMFNWFSLNRSMISERTDFSTVAIWRQSKSIVNLIGLDNVKDIKGKTFEQLLNIKEK